LDALELFHLIEQIATIFGMFALVGMTVLISIEISHVKIYHKMEKLSITPSIGAINNTLFGTKLNNKEKFIIKLKNFGETPAKTVTVYFTLQNKTPTKEKLYDNKENDLDLGPMLPFMEKSYWFYVDSDVMQKLRKNEEQIYACLFISYESEGGKYQYGIVYKYDSHEDGFVKTEMWED